MRQKQGKTKYRQENEAETEEEEAETEKKEVEPGRRRGNVGICHSGRKHGKTREHIGIEEEK